VGLTGGGEAARARNLDHLRAVAALAVLCGHAYALGGRPIPLQAEHWYDAVSVQTATGVWLFFAISGFVISRPFVAALVEGGPLPPLVPYAIRRVLRIYPTYIVALLATVAVVGWIGPKRLVLHGLLLHNLVPGRQGAVLSVAWTLTVEVLFYAAVPVVAAAVRWRWGARPVAAGWLVGAVLVTWAASILWTALGAFADDETISVWLRQVFPSMWGSFCPGILLAVMTSTLRTEQPSLLRRLDDLLDAPRRATLVAAGVGLVAAGLNAYAIDLSHLSSSLVVYDLARPLFAVTYGIVVGLAMRAPAWRGPVGARLQWVGEISYGVYLFHGVLMYWLISDHASGFMPLGNGPVGYVLHVLFLLGITLPLAWASYRFVERPLLGSARRLGERFARRPAPALA
jgi:peptidoglycan/LPS O-acetylase OafA/YrhL